MLSVGFCGAETPKSANRGKLFFLYIIPVSRDSSWPTQRMNKKKCIIHANCQGLPLAKLLAASPEFAAAFSLCVYTNFTRESVPQTELDGCDLFLYQNIGEKWGDVSSESLLARLPRRATAWQIPNCFFMGYWPFWTNRVSMNFGDSLLEHLVGMGLAQPEILHVYLHGDLTRTHDFAALLEASLEVERAKEQGSLVKTVDFICQHWKEEALFSTINHPSPRLLRLVADGVLAALGFAPLESARMNGPLAYSCDSDPEERFELPIHPQVAAFHGLAFGGPMAQYAVFGRRMTFAQYAACYVDCRLRNAGNFLEYLQIVQLG